jgi:hypothetical protein
VSLKEKQKKFSELMSHNDKKELIALENEIRHLNRLNGINAKMLREASWLARQRTKVHIKGIDGFSNAVQYNF